MFAMNHREAGDGARFYLFLIDFSIDNNVNRHLCFFDYAYDPIFPISSRTAANN
jgi:hypothetical protein